ncbi:hypothetical protein [Vibrio sp. VPAP30]|uniref:hypothetical protein n=1 Tax=Vibrio sp. VPAP30 TaxID=1647102 RepID=UPI000657DD2E|nr:hypothetical protein [Vibrio sp. VPAP30]KLN66542.1 hypothetical protein ZX61_02495 [Vibrio sp. VPAP30]
MKNILIILWLISTTTLAGELQCSGTVERLGLHANDRIMLKLSNMNRAVFICSPNSNWTPPGAGYQTSAETCKSMLSMLMHAKSTSTVIGSLWFDGDDVPNNCASWGDWKSANVRYFLY